MRNSSRLRPPIMQAKNSPSGASARRACVNAPGRSLTYCSASADAIRSKLSEANGNASSSPTMPVHGPSPSVCAIGASRVIARSPSRATSIEASCGPGVERSKALGNGRRIASSRSPISATTRSSKKVAAPKRTARARRMRPKARSKMRGGPAVTFGGVAMSALWRSNGRGSKMARRGPIG